MLAVPERVAGLFKIGAYMALKAYNVDLSPISCIFAWTMSCVACFLASSWSGQQSYKQSSCMKATMVLQEQHEHAVSNNTPATRFDPGQRVHSLVKLGQCDNSPSCRND